MIKRLYIDNYRCLVNFEILLSPLTLLVGLNGSGKTSVLDVMYALRQLLAGVAKVADRDVFPSSTLTRLQSRELQVFELDAELGEDTFRYRLEVEHERSSRLCRVKLEELSANGRPLFQCQRGEVQLYRDNHSEGPQFSVDWSESALARVAPRNDNTRLTRFLECIRKTVICGLHPAFFETECNFDAAMLDRYGQNFAAWYLYLYLERQERAPDFTHTLAEILPGFQGIRLEKVGLDTRAFKVMFKRLNDRYEQRLDELSDGQRVLIVLYAFIYLASEQGYTFFLDEPDNYLALAEIQPWLMRLTDICGTGDQQAVLTSHHPELIDYLDPEHGFLLRRESSGVTKAVRLTETTVEDGLRLSERIARGWVS